MDIRFKKDITKPGQDGFGLLFEVNNVPFEIQISGSVLSAFSFPIGAPRSADRLLEYVSFDALISEVATNAGDQKMKSYKVLIDTDSVRFRGKIIYTRDQLRNFVKVSWGND